MPSTRSRNTSPSSCAATGASHSGRADSNPTTSSDSPPISVSSTSPFSVAPSSRVAANSSPVPKSWTKPNSTSSIVLPDATAMLSEYVGISRFAFSDPSIGSITTRTSLAPSPNATVPRSSEIAVKSWPCSCSASSSANTTSSAALSITRVRSPPAPRVVPPSRSTVAGCLPNISRRPSAARRQSPIQSAASAFSLAGGTAQRL